jgi:uncharacterized protein YjiS (DUF1127 family)
MFIELFRPWIGRVGKLMGYAVLSFDAFRKRMRARTASARSIRDLTEMSDRLLLDIGLHREKIRRR